MARILHNKPQEVSGKENGLGLGSLWSRGPESFTFVRHFDFELQLPWKVLLNFLPVPAKSSCFLRPEERQRRSDMSAVFRQAFGVVRSGLMRRTMTTTGRMPEKVGSGGKELVRSSLVVKR